MKFKKVITVAGLIAGVYWAGKINGANIGAKAVLDKYADIIPDDIFQVNLIKNSICTLTTTAKKGK